MSITVVGVGLIGGSIGLAARAQLGAHVKGFDNSTEVLDRALQLGAIDEAAGSLEEAVTDAEVVFIATPVGVLSSTVAAVLAVAGGECAVSDVGSTKLATVAAQSDPRFIGGHPLAGLESAGVEHARADLFEGATWYLTPSSNSSGVIYDRLYRTVTQLGAAPQAIDAEVHDRLMATVSHLPHVLANVLVDQAAKCLGDDGDRLPATGPSFRDATRVAGANSGIWTDIYLSNRVALSQCIDETITRLERVRDLLQTGDVAPVTAWNDEAAELRGRLLSVGTERGPLHELRVSLPNKPGVVATLALELSGAGVNIQDMALYPVPDMSEGVVALWLTGSEEAHKAEQIAVGLGFPVVHMPTLG